MTRDEAYNEWASSALLDRDDCAAWLAARNHNGTTTAQMVARNARDRGEVEADWAERYDIAERALLAQWRRDRDYPHEPTNEGEAA